MSSLLTAPENPSTTVPFFPQAKTYYSTDAFAKTEVKLRAGVPMFFDQNDDLIYAPTAYCQFRSKSASRSVDGARTVGSALKRWLNYCAARQIDWTDPMIEDVTDWRDDMLEDVLYGCEPVSEGTANDYLEHLRSFYIWAHNNRLTAGNPFLVPCDEDATLRHSGLYFPRSLWKLKSESRVPPRAIPKWATDRILQELPEYPYRQMAMVSLGSGARASEVARQIFVSSLPARISVETADPFTSLSLRGKGGVIADIQVPIGLVAKLIRYRDLDRVNTLVRCRRADASYREPAELFIKEKDGLAMTGRTLSKVWAKARTRAGLTASNYDYHGTRHTYAFAMIRFLTRENELLFQKGEPGKDILTTLSNLMRHSTTKSTQAYLTAVDRNEAAASDAVNEYLDSFL
jgi:integrase